MTFDPRVIGFPAVTFNPARRSGNLQLTNAVSSATWTAVGMGGVTANGSAVNVSSVGSAMMINYVTGATSGDTAGIINTAITLTDPRLNPKVNQFIGADFSATDRRLWWGLFSADPSGSDTLGAIVGAGFRFSTSAGDTAIQIVTSDGSSQTVTDTGYFPPGSVGLGDYQMVFDYANSKIHFYTYPPDQGEPFVKLGTHGSGDNFPTDVSLGILSKVTTLDNAAKDFFVGRTYIEMD